MIQSRHMFLTCSLYFLFQWLTFAQTYDIQHLPTVWQAVDSLKEKNQFLKAAYHYEEVTNNGLHDPFTHFEIQTIYQSTKDRKGFSPYPGSHCIWLLE